MITKFDNFLNEFYVGPYKSAGFKNSEPSDKFNFNITMKYKPENEELVKNILAKYEIPYDKLNLEKTQIEKNIPTPKKKFFSRKKDTPEPKLDIQKLDLTFLSYNEYEAGSIINTLLNDLHKSGVVFDPASIKIEPLEKIVKKPIGFQFKEKEEEEEV